jgi:uncharacterized protein YciI/ketosteroid isomerase-like protein
MGNKRIMSTKEKNTVVMFEIFTAIEQRDPQRPDPQRILGLMQPDVEFHWPTSLPYGGTSRGLQPGRPTWDETWNPLQPSAVERKMDPRLLAANDDQVVMLWRQRGVSARGERFDGEVIGIYQLRDMKLARADMFYFDSAAVASFLARSREQTTSANPGHPDTKQNFAIIFKRGSQWIPGKSVREQPLREHGEYLQKLLEDKKLLFAGPFLDDQGGLAVLSVADEAEARDALAHEPATLAHILEPELHQVRFIFDAATGASPFKR